MKTQINEEWAKAKGLIYEETKLESGSTLKEWNGEIDGIEVCIQAQPSSIGYHTLIHPRWYEDFSRPQVWLYATDEECLIKAINFIKSFGK